MYENGKIYMGLADGARVELALNMCNRHGLIAGASGTGKTITMKVMAESFSDAGVPVFLMRGNRDFLYGPRMAARCGATLLPDPCVVELHGRPTLLMHGDLLCTDDVAYQAFRKQVRDPGWQAGFLAQPLAARKTFIAGLRQKSEAAKADKSLEIMDVNADAVAALLRQHGFPVLVHGHTHRPDTHRFTLDGHPCERRVLPDWRGEACWLRYDGSSFTAASTAAG